MFRVPGLGADLCYVRSTNGDYAVQVNLHSGMFLILTDDLTYPGGIGWATEWTTVSEDEVPENVRRELLYAVEGYADYLASRGK
jgi:uncharacterized circularly permuted ATP-grasp superfamily protein